MRVSSGTLRRGFDLAVAVPLSIISMPLCGLLILLATIDTRSFGLFRQRRIGRNGEAITVYKIRSMRDSVDAGTVTVAGDSRITTFGGIMRRLKFDEIPQLWSVVLGDMSLVGPRPDVAGYADELQGDDRLLLLLRPGVTGPATLLFRNEEQFLAAQSDPVVANETVVWPSKVAVNRSYQIHASFRDDLAILDMTLRGTDERLRSMIESWDARVLDRHPVVEQLLQLEGEK